MCSLNQLVVRQRMKKYTTRKTERDRTDTKKESSTADLPVTEGTQSQQQVCPQPQPPIISPSISPSSPESEAGPSVMALPDPKTTEEREAHTSIDQPSTSKDQSQTRVSQSHTTSHHFSHPIRVSHPKTTLYETTVSFNPNQNQCPLI